MPPNSHLKTRLVQPLPLRVTGRKATGRQLCTDVIRQQQKRLYFAQFLCYGRLETNTLCFPGDVSVFKRVDLRFDFPFFQRNVLQLSSHVQQYQLIPRGFILSVCISLPIFKTLQHVVTLQRDFILSSPPHFLKFCVCLYLIL